MSETRPAPDTPEELIWLRGFEAGVIKCRANRNQIIQELIEIADAQSARVISVWLKSQMEGEA